MILYNNNKWLDIWKNEKYEQIREKILNSFLQDYECTVRLESDFAYYSASNIIAYSF